MKIKYFSLLLIGFSVILLAAFTAADQTKEWKVPAKYVDMENPEASNAASLKIGKRTWNKHCASCHGKEGLGDGSKAANLDTPAGDFTIEAFQAQTDGSIFYKSKFGRDDMPNFEKKIPYDEDMWHVVNYMRTFK